MNQREPDYGKISPDVYVAKINTPAKSQDYFDRFHKPLIAEAKAKVKPGNKVFVLDLGCGDGYELDFMASDKDLIISGLDLSLSVIQRARERFKKALVFFDHGDVETSMYGGIFHVGILLNAVVYKPDKMLQCMLESLDRGGKCAVNFRVYGNKYNQAFYDYYTNRGGKLLDQNLIVKTDTVESIFALKVLDYTQCEDVQIRNLVQQVYFQSLEDIREFVTSFGFKINSENKFHFASPVNPDNELDVFILEKP